MMNMNRKHAGLLAGFGVGATLGMLLDNSRDADRRDLRERRRNHRLAARVAAELDEEIEHARGIQVFAEDDRVTLRGIALTDELDDVLDTVRAIEGVRAVKSELDVGHTPARVAALQS
jgi:osmotically-inducible protein OsmY